VHHLVVWFQRLASERASTRAPTASPPAAGRLRSRVAPSHSRLSRRPQHGSLRRTPSAEAGGNPIVSCKRPLPRRFRARGATAARPPATAGGKACVVFHSLLSDSRVSGQRIEWLMRSLLDLLVDDRLRTGRPAAVRCSFVGTRTA